MNRRDLLKSFALIAAYGAARLTHAEIITGAVPWVAGKNDPPVPAKNGLQFLTPAEAAIVAAMADRIIPADELSVSGSEAGCVRYIDNQLAGPFGNAETQYRLGPFKAGTAAQGPQWEQTPAQFYRVGLACVDHHCQTKYGKGYAALDVEKQDAILRELEAGTLDLNGLNVKGFFNIVLQNVREGFFADPIYGGNKDMAGWKMLGFPGARYDYREYMPRKGEDWKIAPISLAGPRA
jgi:gluconate 2-dehydrogenase gamma chain